jgi:hypothetical protein
MTGDGVDLVCYLLEKGANADRLLRRICESLPQQN